MDHRNTIIGTAIVTLIAAGTTLQLASASARGSKHTSGDTPVEKNGCQGKNGCHGKNGCNAKESAPEKKAAPVKEATKETAASEKAK